MEVFQLESDRDHIFITHALNEKRVVKPTGGGSVQIPVVSRASDNVDNKDVHMAAIER